MAYRAMPHSTTKYSPYYLVYGREMRLPIEDDWKPSSGNVNTKEDEHEQHVRELAERLHEANKAAGQHSRMSHDTAKRYYDRHTQGEAETDNEQAETASLPENGNVLVNTHNRTPSGKNKPAVSHSYNLRSRVESTQK